MTHCFKHLLDVRPDRCSRESVLSKFFVSIEVIQIQVVIVSARFLGVLVQLVNKKPDSVLFTCFHDAVKATGNYNVFPRTLFKRLRIHIKFHYFDDIVALLDLGV